jgi:hypothetical protein
VGLSRNHNGVLEAARMQPSERAVREVDVVALDSPFIAGFATATPAPAYLMEDVTVLWVREPAPRIARSVAS